MKVFVCLMLVWFGSSVAFCADAKLRLPCEKCTPIPASGCVGCHPFEGNDHAQGLSGLCERCHGETAPVTDALAKVCRECHEKYSMSKHPKLKHPLRSANDPGRPGMELDCASCHDPHAPDCLSCLERPKLRQWCKECHSTP